MAESKKIVLVGIPGVGKTTLLSRLVEMITEKGRTAAVISFGTVMLEEAKRRGTADRDGLRSMPFEIQRDLQESAARIISNMDDDYILIDTHAFISTPYGYYPGLPEHVLRIISPVRLISVYAPPADIYNRRLQDETRRRDKVSIEGIKKELAYHQALLSACSVISGAPIKAVLNPEGKVDEAARKVINAIGI